LAAAQRLGGVDRFGGDEPRRWAEHSANLQGLVVG
jgi:hypothetical protein